MKFRFTIPSVLIVLSAISGVAALGFILDVIYPLDWWAKVPEARTMGILVSILFVIISALSYKMAGLYRECDKCENKLAVTH